MTTQRQTPTLPSTEAGQTTLSIAETATRFGCSQKRIRRLVKEGVLHADLVKGPYGLQYRVEVATLPPELPTPSAGQGREGARVGASPIIEGLREDLRQARDLYGVAMVEVGRLQASDDDRKRLTAHAESLETRLSGTDELLATERNQTATLKTSLADLRRDFSRRSWLAAALALGLLSAIAARFLVG